MQMLPDHTDTQTVVISNFSVSTAHCPVGWFFFDENFNSSALFSGDSIHYSKTPGGSMAVKYCVLVVRWRVEVKEESCFLLVVLAIFFSFLLLNFNPPAHNHDALVYSRTASRGLRIVYRVPRKKSA